LKVVDVVGGAVVILPAKRELMMAVREDGENPELNERLDALDLALFAMGA